MSATRTGRAYAAALAAAVLLAGCGGGSTPPRAGGSSTSAPPTATASTASSPATTTSPSTSPSVTPTPTRTPRPLPSTHRPTPTPTRILAPAPARCAVPPGVAAAQVVLVDSSGDRASIRACRRVGGHYVLDHGPYAGHVGLNGVSAAKREGDLRTPAGTFPLRGGFGVYGNPGLAMGWFVVGSADVWVDDPASALYNTHQRKPANGRWSSAENLLNRPAYNYAQVIGYNEARTPGRGSAIFLHVDLGGGTAGCVSLPTGPLLTVLRWERAGAVITIR